MDGLVRFNEDRAAAAAPPPAAEDHLRPLHSYSDHLKHALNQKSQRVLGHHEVKDFTKPAAYTGEQSQVRPECRSDFLSINQNDLSSPSSLQRSSLGGVPVPADGQVLPQMREEEFLGTQRLLASFDTIMNERELRLPESHQAEIKDPHVALEPQDADPRPRANEAS